MLRGALLVVYANATFALVVSGLVRKFVVAG